MSLPVVLGSTLFVLFLFLSIKYNVTYGPSYIGGTGDRRYNARVPLGQNPTLITTGWKL